MSIYLWKIIFILVIIIGFFCIGVGVNFTETNDNSVIWVLADSDFFVYKRYVESVYSFIIRFFYLIFVLSNVMSVVVIKEVKLDK